MRFTVYRTRYTVNIIYASYNMTMNSTRAIPVLILYNGIRTVPSISVMVSGKVFDTCGKQSNSRVVFACPSK